MPRDRVTFDYSETRNLGNFNILRVGATVEADARDGESSQQALDRLTTEVIAHVRITKKLRAAKLRGTRAI